MPRTLTDRQGDVLLLMCEGRSERAIAEALRLSPRTVRSYLAQIHRRVPATEAADVCAMAAEDVAAAADRAQRRQASP
jgi:DNA-binding NarL/FixJ family response regulator